MQSSSIETNNSYRAMLTKFFSLVGICCCLINTAVAHDSNLATFQIRHIGNAQWIYEVMTPLYELDNSVRRWESQHSQNASRVDAGSIAYKELLVAYIKKGFKVEVSAENSSKASVNLSLGAGRIKLDSHLTVLIFEIIGMPTTVHQLDFHIASMADNEHQNNIFRLIDGDNSQRYMLTAENNFSGIDVGFFESARP